MNMYIWLAAAVLFTAAFIISFIVEKRRFRNGIYLLFAMIFWYLQIGTSLSGKGAMLNMLSILPFILIPLASIIFSAVFIWAGIVTMKREGLRLKNSLALAAGIGIWGFYALCIVAVSGGGDLIRHPAVLYGLILLVFIACFYVFIFVAFFFYSLLYTQLPKKINCNYIIIHGAGLLGGNKVTPLLARRIDKALQIWKKGGKKAVFVPSGGRGADELISEADAIAVYLRGRGVPESKILKEDRSGTTLENIRNSKELMDADWTGEKPYRCVFVTNNYHVFRTGIYARRTGLKADGVGCRTAMYYWPGAFIREYVAVMAMYKWAVVSIFILWGILAYISSMHM